MRRNPRCLAERYYVTFGLWHEPSVRRLSVRLSSVCDDVAA